MIRLFVSNTSGPPLGLGGLWVCSPRRGGICSPPIVRVIDLFARLDQLDERFGYNSAVGLLKFLECFLIVLPKKTSVAHGQEETLVRRFLRAGICSDVVSLWYCLVVPIGAVEKGLTFLLAFVHSRLPLVWDQRRQAICVLTRMLQTIDHGALSAM